MADMLTAPVDAGVVKKVYDTRQAAGRERLRQGWRLREVLANRYNEGFRDIVAPGEEPVVANLIWAAVRILSQRVARYPRIKCDTVKRMVDDATQAAAERHELALHEDLERIGFKAVLAQACHWQVAHDLMAFVVRPSPAMGSPVIEVRDPLGCLPPDVFPHRPEATDVLFVARHSMDALARLYPAALGLVRGKNPEGILVGEYFTPAGMTVVALDPGPALLGFLPSILPFSCPACRAPVDEPVVIERVACCPACGGAARRPLMVAMGRGFSADGQPHGQFEHSVPVLIAQAKLMSLVMSYMERNVFPTTNVFGELVSNNQNYADGPGAVNMFTAQPGARVEQLVNSMSPQVFSELDRYERFLRSGGNFPAQLSGDPVATIATGKGIEELTASVDDNVAYQHSVVADVVKQTVQLYADTSRAMGCAGSERYLPRDQVRITVRHLAGSDPGETIGLLQKMDAKLISRAEVRSRMDEVETPEVTEVLIETEQLRDALIGGLTQRAALPQEAGGIDPHDVARIIVLRRQGVAIEDALIHLREQAQAAQAAQQDATGQDGGPPSLQAVMAGALGGPPLPGAPKPGSELAPGRAMQTERAMSQPLLGPTADQVTQGARVARTLGGGPA